MIKNISESELAASSQVLVTYVDCRGGMDESFKRMFHGLYSRYMDLCERKLFVPGSIWFYSPEEDEKRVMCMATCRDRSTGMHDMEAVETALTKLSQTYDVRGIESIGFDLKPFGDMALQVEEAIRRRMSSTDCMVYISTSKTNLPKEDDSQSSGWNSRHGWYPQDTVFQI